MKTAWLAFALVVFGLLTACDEGKKPTQAASRFEGVRAEKAADAAGFCERSYPAGAKRFAPAPTRPLPAGKTAAPAAAGRWTWVNLWATWCGPCREEMALLGKWKDTLAREGAPFELELLSVDAPADATKLAAAIDGGLPGRPTWLRGEADLGPFLDGLGVSRDASIPIHALVDPEGGLRCVRVGAIHDRDFGSVRALLTGS